MVAFSLLLLPKNIQPFDIYRKISKRGWPSVMAKKISLIIMSNSGATMKRVPVPLFLVVGVALISLASAVYIGISIFDYQMFHKSMDQNRAMSRTIAAQKEEIGQQRLQIQAFAHEINALKEHLIKLDKFENKIRVIANLDSDKENDSLFGVGGVAPEDLNPQLAVTQRHEGLMREMHRQAGELDTAFQRQESRFSSLYGELEGQRNLLASTPAIRPTAGWLTSRFGYRTSPFTGRKEFHKGLDIANRHGTAILATADGIVTFSGKKGNMGNVLVIDHGHGMLTRYAHLSKALKQTGETVKRGDIIARMGSSGRSTGPHLHYEVHLNGVPVNPARYILN
jgi:murein DD-endopeptidase MepM/ murein hydrolase activator NlpD